MFVWVGAEASVDERKNGLSTPMYTSTIDYPWKAISVIAQGKENDFTSTLRGSVESLLKENRDFLRLSTSAVVLVV